MMTVEIVSGLLGAGALSMFFTAVRSRWPLSYFSASDIVSQRVSGTSVRYVAFRLGPVIVASFFVAVTVSRLDARPWVAVTVLAATHVLATSGRALLSLRTTSNRFARTQLVFIHSLVALGTVAGAAIGLALANSSDLQAIVPTTNEISATLWTAALAGIVGAFLVAVSRGNQVETAQLIRRSRETIPQALWDLADSLASENETNPNLIRTIMLVENLQRPRWIRRFERLKGRLLPRGHIRDHAGEGQPTYRRRDIHEARCRGASQGRTCVH